MNAEGGAFMPGEKKVTILLVEDEPLIALHEKATLEDNGYGVIIVNSGGKALKAIHENPCIDLVLMDINLENTMDGTEAAREILRTREIPLIFLSSHTEREVVEKTEGITSYGYIVKDSGETVLMASIRMAFRLFDAKVQEREKERALKRIEWMLSPRSPQASEVFLPPYGDLVDLAESRVILDAVGKETLMNIVCEFLDLLGTSAAVYEKNGDYACGIISSAWCRSMDAASRRLCGTDDNREALACGKWLCHESCWSRASLGAIETGAPVDIECDGGIHIYAAPIRAGREVVGSINMGYGDPPGDSRRLGELARAYGVPAGELAELSGSYESRPPFIIDLARRRLESSALLIGEIVERKRVEQENSRMAGEWQLTFDASPDAIWILDGAHRVMRSNRAAAELFGTSRPGSPGRFCFDIVHRTDEPVPPCPFVRAKKTLQREFMELDAGARRFQVMVDPILDRQGRCTGAVHYISDITARKQAEQQLVQEKAWSERIINSAPNIIVGLGEDSIITIFNAFAEQLTGYAAEEMIGKSWIDHFVPADEREQIRLVWDDIVRNRYIAHHHENEIVTRSGERRLISWNNSLLTDHGEFKIILSIGEDITDRRQAEDEIRLLLREKELLLKEAHHRVKNNMGVVKSLLSLQAQRAGSPEARMVLQEAAGRVQSMAVLYDRLYRGKEHHEMDIREFLPPLIDGIVAIFPRDPAVSMVIEVEEMVLGARVLSSIGIILNECITNSMKYAFDGCQNPTITINASKKGARALLVYTDNGPGIPGLSPEINDATFGFQLISLLAGQIGGTLTVDGTDGMKVEIEF